MMNVQTEQLPDLICVTCKKVLSQFPIYCHAKGPTCGRCPYPPNGIRNEAYEIVTQKMKFPCCNNENGCLENLFPKDVQQHEATCPFRKYECPIICNPKCEWRDFSFNLEEHVNAKHRMFLLTENSFEVDFVNSHNENYVLLYGEGIFLVNRRMDSKTHLFFCTVSNIGSSGFTDKCFYNIILESGNKSHVHKICNPLNTTTQIDRVEVTNILNDPISIIAKIEIFQKEEDVVDDKMDEQDENPNINYDLLRELECMVCMEYMIPPIYQCMTGHSICQKCKTELEQCPTCKQEYKDTQNYALAQVINHIDYPCKHNKCKFVSKARDIKQHEATCIFAPYPCPLDSYESCSISIQFEELYDHIVKYHYENLLEMDFVTMPFFRDSDDIEDAFIIKHGTRLFLLHFAYFGVDEEFRFAMQLVGPAEEADQYRFEIDISDMTGKNQRAYCTRSCGPLTKKNDCCVDGTEFISFTLQQIGHLITDQLRFRVRVAKNQ